MLSGMDITYSTYEAKSRFSEVIRHIREGRTVTVSYRGEPVAEIRPVEKAKTAIEQRTQELERRGALSAPRGPRVAFEGGVHVPGALKRFLEERDR